MNATRGVFFEEHDAQDVLVKLRRDGYDSALGRDRFAGEDDDLDHAWIVTTDAPEWVLDLLVDEYDGWLDLVEQPHGAQPPLELPAAPRRFRREE